MTKELASDRVAVPLHYLIIIIGLGEGTSIFEGTTRLTTCAYLIMHGISGTRRHVSNDPGTLAGIFGCL